MPTLFTPAQLDLALKQAMTDIAAGKRGQAAITATTTGLEAAVGWRIAPWWEVTGVVQKPWGAPFQGAVRTNFKW